MKKRVIVFLTVLFIMCFPMKAYAHEYDYWNGKYTMDDQKYLRFIITESAQTSLFTRDVYSGITQWDGISSNVTVLFHHEGESTVIVPPPILTIYSPLVLGKSSAELDGAAGMTLPYGKDGKPATSQSGANADWTHVHIYLSIDDRTYSVVDNPAALAKKVITHEVGHALKLSHPVKDSSLQNHSYGGYPMAIMNQGIPYNQSYGNTATSPSVAYHDRINLIKKWGA